MCPLRVCNRTAGRSAGTDLCFLRGGCPSAEPRLSSILAGFAEDSENFKVQEGPESCSQPDDESHEPYNFQRSSKTQCANKRTVPDGILAEVRVFRRTISMITYTPLIQTEASL